MQSEPLFIDPNPSKGDVQMLIREIGPADAEAAAELCGELGYPSEVEAMKERIGVVSASMDRVVYVACIANTVIGWIDVGIIHHLASGSYGEIAGLVVSDEHRGAGIGRKLITQAERWVAEQGMARMVVRSRVARGAAHRFYLREGYEVTKTVAVFSKQLKA